MKLKHLLLSVSCAAVAFGASAQSHHGYFFQPNQDAIDASLESDASAPTTLTLWFDTDFAMPMIISGTDMVQSSIYSGNKTDMIPRQSKIDENAAKIHGAVVEGTLIGNKLVVTIPNQTQYPEPANITAPGTMLFHILLGSKPNRINDAENTLSYTGDRAYLSDCTAMRIGIKVPAGAIVKGYISTPNINTKNAGGYDALGDVMRTAAFDFDNVPANKYVEITSGKPYNSLACIELNASHNSSWPDGYCAKFVDIAVSNVNPGDVIEFTGVQTLHDGWNPVALAGIEDVEIDTNADAPVEYYNLQGIRVEKPTTGLYISRQGDKVTKVIL